MQNMWFEIRFGLRRIILITMRLLDKTIQGSISKRVRK